RRVGAGGVCANVAPGAARTPGTASHAGCNGIGHSWRRRQAGGHEEGEDQEDQEEGQSVIRGTRTGTHEVSCEKRRTELRFEAEVSMIPRLYRLSSQRPRFASPQ